MLSLVLFRYVARKLRPLPPVEHYTDDLMAIFSIGRSDDAWGVADEEEALVLRAPSRSEKSEYEMTNVGSIDDGSIRALYE